MAAILVIHSSPAVRETAAIVLGGEHDVTVAPSWDAVGAVAPDVVVFGTEEPSFDVSGAAAIRERVAPDAPLLVLRAPGDAALAAIAPPSHPVAYLPRPFDARGLRASIRMLLGPRA